jgi:lysine 2,3-aminomutase
MEKERTIITSTSILDSELLEPPSLSNNIKEDSILKSIINKDFPVISEKTKEFIRKYFPNVSFQEWNNWHWQIRNSFTSFNSLNTFLQLSEEEKLVSEKATNLPVRITPYYASLLSCVDDLQPLRRTMVPVNDELKVSKGEASDPLGEHTHNKVNCIVHRYPDRVLFLVTEFCSAYCRYCTRTHMVAKSEKNHTRRAEWDKAIDYITQHTEVRDVLLSGGDPLTLADSQIEYLLSKLRAIPHVEIIRIGSKVPVVLPQRITPSLVKILKKFHPLFISIHFTHYEELTDETKFACNRLADAGIPMGSQTVLLKGINDSIHVYTKLTHELLKVRVRPYYLYQCDPILGSAHFRTSVEKGLEIIKGIRGFTSGYAIPHYVIDAPGGGGKIPILPDYNQGKDDDGNLVLKNFEGKTYKYPDYL